MEIGLPPAESESHVLRMMREGEAWPEGRKDAVAIIEGCNGYNSQIRLLSHSHASSTNDVMSVSFPLKIFPFHAETSYKSTQAAAIEVTMSHGRSLESTASPTHRPRLHTMHLRHPNSVPYPATETSKLSSIS